MKLNIISIFVFFFFIKSGEMFSQDKPLRVIKQQSFVTGEKLTFSIGWEFISAGTAVLSVGEIRIIKNRPCYQFSAVTSSNSFFSTMYKVRDTLYSYTDVEGLYPLQYSKAANEGNYQRHFTVDFDHENLQAHINDIDSGQTTISIPMFVQDIISSFYFMRTQDVKVGQNYTISVFDNGKAKNVKIEVVKKETVEVEAGEFNCIVVKTPIGPFKNKSDLFIWLTDDRRKMPVLMKSKIAIGSVRAELETYYGTY
jgi:hypothetical protein